MISVTETKIKTTKWRGRRGEKVKCERAKDDGRKESIEKKIEKCLATKKERNESGTRNEHQRKRETEEGDEEGAGKKEKMRET